MRIAGGLLLLLLCGIAGARAQVTVDMHALDSLGPAPVARPAPTRPPSTPSVASPRTASVPSPRSTAASSPAPAATVPRAGAGAAAVSPAPGSARTAVARTPAPAAPPAAAGAPVPPLPTTLPSEPPPATTAPAAAASPLPVPPPVRLVFDEGKADLTPAEEAAIRDLAHSIPVPDASAISVTAYAAGKPDDPSTARRLSLSRGLAVRSVLLASGVPSAQIYVRALGAAATDGPADRVELTVGRIGTVTQ